MNDKVKFDLADLDTSKASDDGAEIEIKHPVTGEGLGIFITVLGKHSSTFRELVKERADKRLRENATAERRGKQVKVPSADEIERGAIELLAACTKDWRNMHYKGENLPFNAMNAIRIYTDLIWLREQVDEAIGDLENFIEA